MTWNNTSQDDLLERDLFTPAPAIEGCCCWQVGQCYSSWPDKRAPDGIYRPSQLELDICTSSCDWSAPAQEIVLNLTETQKNHLNCGQDPPLYGLDQYNDPPIPLSNGWLQEYCTQKSKAEKKAALWMSIPYYINVASSPILGFVIDRFGQCATICAISPIILTVVHLLLAFCEGYTVPLLVAQGVAYSFFAAALWPPVVYIVEEKQIGAAYGVITSLMNAGFSVFPLVAAYVYQQNGNSYLPDVECFYAGLAFLGVVVGVALLVRDGQIGSPFNRVHWFDDADEKATS